jgi:hypothetical protein
MAWAATQPQETKRTTRSNNRKFFSQLGLKYVNRSAIRAVLKRGGDHNGATNRRRELG